MILLKGILKSTSPFMIGSGDAEISDQDVLRDADGKPFIPGTTLAGICRHYLNDLMKSASKTKDHEPEEKKEGLEEKKSHSLSDVDLLFGEHYRISKDLAVDIESGIIFYDAFLIPSEERRDKNLTSVRDSVRLQDKIAVNKSKYDYEVVEAGAEFLFRIQVDETALQKASEILKNNKMNYSEIDVEDSGKKTRRFLRHLSLGFNNGDIRIGAKTTRGFGEFKLDELKYKGFDLKNPNELMEYIDFGNKWDLLDADAEELWKGTEQGADDFIDNEFAQKYEVFEVNLLLKNFLLIRNYASTARTDADDKDGKFVDSEAMMNSKGNIVIPGTAWAGVFRSHMKKLLLRVKGRNNAEEIDEILNEAMGYQTKVKNGELVLRDEDKLLKSKSKIFFSESEIEKDSVTLMNRTRTAVDRFTGSALQTGALFTDRIACVKEGYEGGCQCTLKVKVYKDLSHYTLIKSLIEATIEDLKSGLVAVGGTTSIGGGIFTGKDTSEVEKNEC